MTIQKTHSLETVGGVSLAVGGTAADGADMRRTQESVDGLSLDLLDALTLLAQDRVRGGGLRLVGEDGLLPAITQHLMQAALEAELEEHLAAEAECGGGRGSRSGGNGRNGYRTKKVMSEVGPITLQIPRDRLGTFRPRILPKGARRTGALDEMVLSLTARGMTSEEIVAHLEEVYGMKTSKETISTITDKALDSMNEWRTRPLKRSTRSSSSTPSTSRSGTGRSPTGPSTWPSRSPPMGVAPLQGRS
jgi:hypothetical protein